MRFKILNWAFCFLFVFTNFGVADNWPHWRGPSQDGVSLEKNLISEWSKDGKNLLWKRNFISRSTPIVIGNHVYVLGRTGQDVTEQEHIACFHVQTGEQVWEHKFNVFHTTIPFNRVGWASPAGDPETGNVYVHGVQGMFYCFSPKGEILWSHSLTEEFGRISGYGGRTHTPFIDGNLVVISYLNSSWGDQVATRHRYFAFNKNTGDLVWVSTPSGPPKDTTYSVPVVVTINNRRLLIAGNADGAIYAMDMLTGKKVWGFKLSKRGINVSVVADGHLVYAAHSEENIDNTSMGRVVCIDGRGTGDVTGTHEVWRFDSCQVGYTSPALHHQKIYLVDNSANMHCLDAKTGEEQWVQNIGTVGKGSPVWADGKIYVSEVNGHFHILKVGPGGVDVLSTVELSVELEDRAAEIYGSPAISDGRIFFATEEGIYCLGRAKQIPVTLQLTPAEVVAKPGQKQGFKLFSFVGDELVNSNGAVWSVRGLDASVSDGELSINPKAIGQAGMVSAILGDAKASARVRVIPPLPWTEDFELVVENKVPTHWIGAIGKFFTRQQGDNKILVKTLAKRGLNRSVVFLGPPKMSNYTVKIDLMGTRNKRRLPDMGLVANRYILDLQGIHQRLQVRSWSSDLRMAKHVDFNWETDAWYVMKMRVDLVDEEAIVLGKVWKKSDPEPNQWTIKAIDPLPNKTGSPGIYGYSAAEIYYDNLKVTMTE